MLIGDCYKPWFNFLSGPPRGGPKFDHRVSSKKISFFKTEYPVFDIMVPWKKALFIKAVTDGRSKRERNKN